MSYIFLIFLLKNDVLKDLKIEEKDLIKFKYFQKKEFEQWKRFNKNKYNIVFYICIKKFYFKLIYYNNFI